jgi:enoyl-CoA hydratase
LLAICKMAVKTTTIETSTAGTRRVITLVPAEGKPPVLDPEVLASLEEAVLKIEDEVRRGGAEAPRSVVLQSASSKYFCVGANLNVLKSLNEENFGDWLELGHRVFSRIEALPVPVVAKVGGYALGGGLELAMAADVIVASQSARLGLTEARLGFVPGWGGVFRLAERVGRSRAKQLYFAGEIIDGSKAAALGVVDRVTSDDTLDSAVEEWTDAVAENNTTAIAAFKRILDDERGAARDRVDAAEVVSSIDCIRDPDTKERIERFLSKSGK